MVEGALVINPARLLDAVRDAIVQPPQTPLRKGDADHRDRERASFHHRIEGREDHLVSEIAGYTEEHQRVRAGGSHQATSLLAMVFFPHRRKPPTKAFVLSPKRVPGGSVLMCFALPPPSTTYSASKALFSRLTTSAT